MDRNECDIPVLTPPCVQAVECFVRELGRFGLAEVVEVRPPTPYRGHWRPGRVRLRWTEPGAGAGRLFDAVEDDAAEDPTAPAGAVGMRSVHEHYRRTLLFLGREPQTARALLDRLAQPLAN